MKNNVTLTKQFLSLFLAVALIFGSLPFSMIKANATDGTFAGGGTETDPYQIVTLADLNLLASKVNGGETQEGVYFKQTANVEIIGEYIPIGTFGDRFKGNYDGGNYEISGKINQLEIDYVGVFGYTESATIKSLGVSATVTGKTFVGGVVGASAGSTITNCYKHRQCYC